MKLSHSIPVLVALAFLASCAKKEAILQGERLDIRADLTGEFTDPTADDARAVPVSLPPVQANSDWTHRNGNAAHRLPHPALNAVQGHVFTANIGQGNSRKFRIGADPIVSGGRIFTMDARNTVTATGTNGATLWSADITKPDNRAEDASGGGIAVAEGRVYVTTGFGELLALDASSGAIVWRQAFDASIGGAPAVSGGIVYVVARDSSAWAVRASNGRVEWQAQGLPSSAGVTGVSAPAISDKLVIFPFPSGELVAFSRDKGTRVWGGKVGGARLGRAYAAISDLTGDPVIAGNTVYAGSSAGRLAAVDLETGRRIWTATEGAVSPVWPAGNAIYMVSDEARLVRLDADTGEVVWRVDMPYYTKDKIKRQKAIFAHFGPVLAGGRLYVASSGGQLQAFDPASGALLASHELPGGAASAPVVAGGVLYVVSAKGQLHAFR